MEQRSMLADLVGNILWNPLVQENANIKILAGRKNKISKFEKVDFPF